MPEYLRSNKLNRTARNQTYLHHRKTEGRFKYRDPSSRENLGTTDENIKIYAEYREISTSPSNDGDVVFFKNFKMPKDFFSASAMPVCFVSLQRKPNAISKVSPMINNPTANQVRLRARTLGNDFEDDMDYVANILVLGSGNLTNTSYNFMPVYFGNNEEKLQLSSQVFSQMGENSDYLAQRRVQSVLRNVDYVTEDPDLYLKYLNDNIVMYAKYEEFNPRNDEFDRNDNADEDSPKKFSVKFDFPDNIFDIKSHPVVIFNVGAKVVAEPGTEIRKITGILKSVKRRGFVLEIREYSESQEFSTQDIYFCTYVAIGERFTDTGRSS